MTDQPEAVAPSALDGATALPPEAVQLSTPGEFAAMWNSMAPAQREDWFASWRDQMDRAWLCFVHNHAAAIEALQRSNLQLRDTIADLHPEQERPS